MGAVVFGQRFPAREAFATIFAVVREASVRAHVQIQIKCSHESLKVVMIFECFIMVSTFWQISQECALCRRMCSFRRKPLLNFISHRGHFNGDDSVEDIPKNGAIEAGTDEAKFSSDLI